MKNNKLFQICNNNKAVELGSSSLLAFTNKYNVNIDHETNHVMKNSDSGDRKFLV